MRSLVVRFAGASVALEVDGPRSERVAHVLFERVVARRQRRRREGGAPSSVIRLFDRGTEIACSKDGAILAEGTHAGPVAEILLGQVCADLAAGTRGGLLLHASALRGAGRAWIMAGESGAGKTTLTAWLVANGREYLTDEMVFVAERRGARAGTWSAAGFSRPLHLKAGGARVMAPLVAPCSPEDAWTSFEAGSLVDPSRLRERAAPSFARPTLDVIVFPRFVPDVPTRAERLTPGLTAMRLMENLANRDNLPGRGLAETARLARTVPAFSLVYGRCRFEEVDDALARILANPVILARGEPVKGSPGGGTR